MGMYFGSVGSAAVASVSGSVAGAEVMPVVASAVQDASSSPLPPQNEITVALPKFMSERPHALAARMRASEHSGVLGI